jgi:hypothetical protein
MIAFDVEFKNLDYLDKLGRAFTPAEFRKAILPGMKRGFYMVHQHLPPYPSPPENSSYVRTGKLGQSITEEVTAQGNDVVGVIGSNIQYAPYVIGGDDEQAWMHEGRWWQLPNVVEKDLDAISDEVGRSIEAYLASL